MIKLTNIAKLVVIALSVIRFNRRHFLLFVLFYSCLFDRFVYASTLPSLLDNLGFANNINKPEIWQDQLSGFATGGSLHMRAPSTDLSLLTLDMPSLNAGCSGIDLFGGGFGYINSKQLESLMKNIGTSAISYSMMLTIKSISPMVADLLENLEAMARFVNAQNINSCQLGASIASGMFMRTQAAQNLACSTRKMGQDPHSIGDAASSFFTARYDCQNIDTLKATNDKTNDGFLGSNYNLVFKALDKAVGGSSASSFMSVEDKEFLMSLSGTLIVRAEKDKTSFEHKTALIKDTHMLEALVFGDRTHLNLYKCHDLNQGCLQMTKHSTPFEHKNSVVYKVRTLLSSIAEKIIEENSKQKQGTQSLTAAEKHLATTTSIPIIKLISLNAGLKGHGVSLTIEDYAESVAFDYVISYLDSLLDFVYGALSLLEYSQTEGDTIKAFKEELRFIKQMLNDKRVRALERLNTLLAVKQRTSQIEQMVLSNFREYRA